MFDPSYNDKLRLFNQVFTARGVPKSFLVLPCLVPAKSGLPPLADSQYYSSGMSALVVTNGVPGTSCSLKGPIPEIAGAKQLSDFFSWSDRHWASEGIFKEQHVDRKRERERSVSSDQRRGGEDMAY